MKSIFNVLKNSTLIIPMTASIAFASSTNSLYDDFIAKAVANCNFQHGTDTIKVGLNQYNEWEAGRYVLNAKCFTHSKKNKIGSRDDDGDESGEEYEKVGNPDTVPSIPDDPPKACGEETGGSIIYIDSRTAGESLHIGGTDFDLIYLSSRVWGNKSTRSMTIPFSDTNSLVTEIDISGNYYDGTRTFSATSPNAIPLNKYYFEWDGYDHVGGSKVHVPAPLEFDVTYTVYGKTIPIHYTKVIGNRSIEDLKIGGWEPTILHYYDFLRGELLTAGGSFTKVNATVVGDGTFMVPAEDGSEVYYFSATGQHLKTVTGLLGTPKYIFNYTDNLLTSITDGYGKVTTLNRNSNGYVTSIIAPGGQATTLTYDANNYLATLTNAAGSTYTMTYYGSDGLMHTFTEPEGQVSTFTFDEHGLLTQDAHSGGSSLTFTQELAETFHAIKRINLIRASGRSRKKEIQNVFESANEYHSSTTYESGRSFFSRNSDMSSGEYYGNYRTNRDLAVDPRFNGALRYIARESVTSNTTGLSVMTRHDIKASLNRAGDPYSIGTLSETTTKGTNVWQNNYSGSAKTWTAISPEGKSSVTKLDSLERPVSNLIGNLSPTLTTYDSTTGKIKSVSQGDRITMMNYDSSGNLSSIVNPLGQTTSFAHDGMGKVISQTTNDGRKTTYTYDLNGKLKTITPDGKGTHTFNYNGEQLLSEYIPPSLGSGIWKTQYFYDVDKNITQIIRPDGQTINFHYDPNWTRIDQMGTSDDTTYIGYGADNKVTFLGTQGINLNINYNGTKIANESHTACCGGAYNTYLEYSYNDRYKLSRISVNNASSKADLFYDKDELLRQIGDMAISRNSIGKVASLKLGQTEVHYSYDSSYGQLSKIEYRFKSKPELTLQYMRDKLGRISAESKGQGLEKILYDKAGRFVGRMKPYSTEALSSFVYDSNGNRISGFEDRRAFTATYDAQDRLMSYNNKTYQYNHSGERTLKAEDGLYTTYSYTGRGFLNGVYLPNKNISYLTADHDQRVTRQADGVTIRYIWKSNYQPLAELSDAGVVQKFFVYATERNSPDYIIMNENQYLLVKDARGSVVMVVDSKTGEVKQQLTYSEWGEVISDTNPGFQPFGFAGGLYDKETKLVHFGAREYDPQIGRWLSKDLLGFDGGDTNLYGYAINDPINLTDSSGLDTDSIGVTFTVSVPGYSGSFTINFNKDDKGGSSVTVTLGHGGNEAPSAGFSATVNGTHTNADSVSDLNGNGASQTVSAGDGLAGQVGAVEGSNYVGYTGGLGVGAGGSVSVDTTYTWSPFTYSPNPPKNNGNKRTCP